MRQFKWIEWNLQKIAAHHLSADEVEAAFDRVLQLQETKGWFLPDVRSDAFRPPDMGSLAL